MKLRNLALVAAVFVGLTNMAGAAFAQTKVFVINEERVRRDSKLGKELNAALGTIANQGSQQLGLEQLRSELKVEADALKPQTESLTPEALNANPTLKARVEAMNKKANDFLQRTDVLNNNLEQRSQNFSLAFLQVLGPAIDAVAKEVNADVVVSSSSTWVVKDAIDITPKVIARLDATVPTMAALQAALPPPPAPAAGQPGAPAAPPKPQGGQ